MKRAIIDFNFLFEREAAHDLLSEALGFPDYYGRNLDALYDCLNEYSGLIIIKNADFSVDSGYAKFVAKVISSADEANPNLSCAWFKGDIPPKNEYHKNLSRLEFVMTYACTGNCRHCSEAGKDRGFKLDGEAAAKSAVYASAVYDIESVMAFGGEPLIFAKEVAKIMKAAKNSGVRLRQIITNGFFSNDEEEIKKTARLLKRCGVNGVLLSVDSFHQEVIPAGPVKLFAGELISLDIPVKLNPAWLVSKTDRNPYNLKTFEALKDFKAMGIPEASGNIVFKEGAAKENLSEYFGGESEPINPYEQDPNDVKAVCLCPDGTLYGRPALGEEIIEAIAEYKP